MKALISSILKSKGGTVHSISPDTSVFDALQRMAEANVGALIVMQDNKLVGIVSERDYARKIILLGRSSSDTPVSAIMSTKVICARPDQTIGECMGMMTAKAVRHLPVLDHKEVVGIVSIGDLVKAIIGEQQFVIEQLENYIHGH
ncbi:MAG: CBS domain-containing protein [Hyphomicrobiaceae bacterium]